MVQNERTPFSRIIEMRRGNPVLFFEIFDHERLLCSPDQTRGGLFDWQLQPRMNRGAIRGHQNVQPHHIARGIVQQQVDVVERDHGRQPMGEVIEQIVQVPVSRNRFRDLQQKSQAIALVAQLELNGPIAFVVQDIVNRNRDLLHDEVEELQVRAVDGMRARRAESIAPRGRTVVVSGSMQNDSTPSAWTSDAAVEKRSASSCGRTMTGCCVVNARPLNDAVTGTSRPGGIRSPSTPPSMCTLMTFLTGS